MSTIRKIVQVTSIIATMEIGIESVASFDWILQRNVAPVLKSYKKWNNKFNYFLNYKA